MSRVFASWRRYWEAPGGRYATAVMRLAIGFTLLLLLWRYTTRPAELGAPRYFKHGIWLLVPGRPSAALLKLLLVVGWASTVAMVLGLWSRASHAVSWLATMAIAAWGVSDTATWSHTDVPAILASTAFLGARSGDVLALDAWWARRRGRVLAVMPTQTSVRLVQVAVACVFATAAFAKLRAGGFTLAWALSDSLRNHLLVHFDLSHDPRTAAAQWLLGASWRWRVAATLNLISQLLPLATIFLVKYPKLRALAGLCFVAEVLGLGFVMDLWNLHWIPLAAVFIDWDALAEFFVRRPDVSYAHGARTGLHVVYATLFVGFFLAQAFWLNQRLNAYPFSAFPMFAQVRAKQPYDEHQTYEVMGGHVEVEPPLVGWQADWLDSRGGTRWLFRSRDPAAVHAALVGILDEVHRAFPDVHVTAVRYSLARYQAPAYPAPARLDRIDLALLGTLTADGTFTSALGTSPANAMWFPLFDIATEPVALGAPIPAPYLAVRAPSLPAASLPWLVR